MQVDLYLPAGRQLVFWRVRIWRSLRMNRGLHCPSIDAGDWIPHNNSGINCHSFIFLFIFSLFLSFSLFFSLFLSFPPFRPPCTQQKWTAINNREAAGGGDSAGWMDGLVYGWRGSGPIVGCGFGFQFSLPCLPIDLVISDWFRVGAVLARHPANIRESLEKSPEHPRASSKRRNKYIAGPEMALKGTEGLVWRLTLHWSVGRYH